MKNESNSFDEPSHSLRNLLSKQDCIVRLANITSKEEYKRSPYLLNGGSSLKPAPLRRSRSLRNNISPLYASCGDISNLDLEDHLEKSTKRL